MITQLGYVGFGVSDLEAWERFATRFVGLAVEERGADGTLYLRMDEYHHRIALHPSGEDDLLYAGWLVPGPRELDELRKRLESAGVKVSDGTPDETAHRKVRRLIKFPDPSGHPLEAFYGPRIVPARPFVPSRPMTGFRAGPGGLGHIVTRASDIRESERFYTDVLGLRLTDYGSGRLAFLRANRRHHSIAFGEIPGSGWIVHIMLEVQTIDDLGTAFDVGEREGVPLLKGIGRHPNDRMISFYARTPSRFELELGYGGRDIEEESAEVQTYERGDLWGHKVLIVDEEPARPAPARTKES